jgi:hypothetical protein
VKFGRKPKLTTHQKREARERIAAGETQRSDGTGGDDDRDPVLMRSNNGRRLERNRKFVDSPLEGGGFEPSVPGQEIKP